MKKYNYPWQRFLYERDKPIRFDERGYLYDPRGPFGNTLNPNVTSFEAITALPCLVLLGEPGMGKSISLLSHFKDVQAQAQGSDNKAVWCDLGQFHTDVHLHDSIFKHPDIVAWWDSTNHLSLFLDGLDECRLHIPTTAKLLANKLRGMPRERLTLRIACRAAEWPQSLEAAIYTDWPEEQVGFYDLAPLRHHDVIVAASTFGVPVESFLAEIERAQAVPLAIKPITLDFLLKLYRRDGRLPTRQVDLYREGCRELCKEWNEERSDTGLAEALRADQRLRAAEHIAYLTIFGNRATIWTGIDTVDVPEHAFPVQAMAPEAEQASLWGETAIQEALRTGLFSARGSYELGWGHQTYAEFLAASYVVHQRMSLQQVMSLLQHGSDRNGRISPQLHETAAWLANLDQPIFHRIMACDPEVLLRSDVATANPADRAALVVALLRLFDQELLLDNDYRLHRHYRKLAHPDLANQLRNYIPNKQKGFLVRRVAIDIAEACEVHDVEDALAEVGLDPTDLHHVRVQAAWALVRIASTATTARLRPLVFGLAGDDPNDELRGCALRAMWPAHLSAEELFRALEGPKQEAHSGSYQSFLTNRCVPHIQPGDLPGALRWAIAHFPDQPGEDPRSLHHVAADIMQHAWTHIEGPGVLEVFVEAVLARLIHHLNIFSDNDAFFARQGDLSEKFLNDHWLTNAARLHVVKHLLPELITRGLDPRLLVYSRPPLIMETDFDWLMIQLQSKTDPGLQAALATIIARIFRFQNPEHFKAAYDVVQQNEFLASALRHVFGVFELGSEEAHQLKAEYDRWQDIERQRQERRERQEQRIPDPPLAERIQQHLAAFEAGALDAWWRLLHTLQFDPAGGPTHGDLQVDLRALPGWQNADESTHARMLQAAKQYVLEAYDDPSQWRHAEEIIIYRPTFAAYRALYLLAHEDQSTIMSLPPEVWARWAPIIVGYPEYRSTTNEAPHQLLTALAYHFAPLETTAALIYEIDKDNHQGRSPTMLWKFVRCWDEALAAALFEKAQDPALNGYSLKVLLEELFEHHPSNDLQTFTVQLIRQPISEEEEPRRKTLSAAIVLMTQTPDVGWSTIWPVIHSNHSFGRELVLMLAHTEDRRAHLVGARLHEEQIADLYLWLEHEFPRQEDPIWDLTSNEMRTVTAHDDLVFWRNALITALKLRGTPAAVESLRRLQDELPEQDWLRWVVLEAEAVTRRETWTPLSPQELMALAQDSHSRVIQNGEQLLEVIIESLGRLQQTLRDETPTVFRLWNEAKKTYCPKDEERLSDEIKTHLQVDLAQRGVVVNREVVIRPTVPGFEGERLDLKVQAISHEHAGELDNMLTAIIEVKGCWNRELPDAMEKQLCDRYLRENTCQHGLYLVGWFNCLAWDDSDYRKGDAHRLAPELDAARDQLANQARRLTTGGRTIRSFILDATLPQNIVTQAPTEPKKRQRKSKKNQVETTSNDKVSE